MLANRLIRWVALLSGAVVLLIVLAVGLLAILDITVSLSGLRGPIESAAGDALGRRVHIDGDILIVPALAPTVRVEGLVIENPEGWKQRDMLSAKRLQGRMAILPLLRGEIEIHQITGNGVSANLATRKDGASNWKFRPSGSDRKPEHDEQAGGGSRVDLYEISDIDLGDLHVTYLDASLDRQFMLRLDELKGAIPYADPMDLHLRGEFQSRPFDLELSGASIRDLYGEEPQWPLRLKGTVAGSPVNYRSTATMRGGVHHTRMHVSARHIDVGGLLGWLNVAQGLQMRVDSFEIDLNSRGRTVREWLENSTLASSMQGGYWNFRLAEAGDPTRISIRKSRLNSSPGKPATMQIEGGVDDVPVEIKVATASIRDFLRHPERLPVTVTMKAGDGTLRLSANAELPFVKRKMDLSLQIDGRRLDMLDPLTRVSLPPLGPYHVEGRLKIAPDRYEISRMMVRVGSSTLRGTFRYVIGSRPRIRIDLHAPAIQLADFRTGNWALTEAPPEKASRDVEGGNAPPEARETSAATALLDFESLNRLDGELTVRVDDVLSGSDALGSGRIDAVLKNGTLTLSPISLNIPGGKVDLDIDYHPTATDVGMTTRIHIENLDYGVLARRYDPKSDFRGLLSVDIDLSGRAPTAPRLMEHASGKINFLLQPEKLKAGLFRLWTANLIATLLTQLIADNTTKVNCVVGRFDVEDGLATEDTIFIDTTTTQVAGTTRVDFRSRHILLTLTPQPKKPRMFSLETPLQVDGSFDEFGIGMQPGGLIGTTIHFLTSPVHAPLRRIFGKRPPADGKLACKQAWRGTLSGERKDPG